MAMATINQLFDNIHDLPQVPDVVSELISQMNNPKIDMGAMPKINGLDSAEFWEMTFNKAFFAKSIANELNLDSDIAFTAGLLSNIGTTLIFLGDPHAGLEVQQHVKASSKMRYDFEKSRLGFTSADVAAELSRRWKFPEDLVNAIGESAEPLAQTSCSDVACAVHIAEYLSVNKEADDEALMENFPSDVADRIGFTAELLADLVSSSSTSQLSGLAA